MPEIAANSTLEIALLLSRKEEENRLLLEMLRTKDAALGLMEEQVKLLTNQVAWLKRQLFGRKSERIDPNQMFLDSVVIEAVEQNPPAEPAPAGPDIVIPAHTRQASPCGRGELPADLPREIGDDPYAYLLDVMRRMPLLKTTEIGTLIPERWTAMAAAPAAE
jgi:hypothetical protein